MKSELDAHPAWCGRIDDWIDGKSLTANSERSFRREARKFVAWWLTTPASKRGGAVGAAEFENYLESLRKAPSSRRLRRGSGKPLKESSRLQAHRIVANFLKFVASSGGASIDLATLPRTSTVNSAPLEARAGSNVLSAALISVLNREVESDVSEATLRAIVIAQLAFWSGAYREEIASLKVRHLRRREMVCELSLPASNGRRVWISIPRHVFDTARRYVGRRQSAAAGGGPLVVSLNSSEAVTGWSIYQALSALNSDQFGIGGRLLTLRGLRTAFVLLAARAGIADRDIACHLRQRRIAELPGTLDVDFSRIAASLAKSS